mmetsp:Transcript_7663/g.16602  ORF Transcript_7663/g.16602 Transcript_7663/m.16602 type:complete len:223 (-) Transcript_7663:556-1224(-)
MGTRGDDIYARQRSKIPRRDGRETHSQHIAASSRWNKTRGRKEDTKERDMLRRYIALLSLPVEECNIFHHLPFFFFHDYSTPFSPDVPYPTFSLRPTTTTTRDGMCSAHHFNDMVPKKPEKEGERLSTDDRRIYLGERSFFREGGERERPEHPPLGSRGGERTVSKYMRPCARHASTRRPRQQQHVFRRMAYGICIHVVFSRVPYRVCVELPCICLGVCSIV